jgi:hypothetical protein
VYLLIRVNVIIWLVESARGCADCNSSKTCNGNSREDTTEIQMMEKVDSSQNPKKYWVWKRKTNVTVFIEEINHRDWTLGTLWWYEKYQMCGVPNKLTNIYLVYWPLLELLTIGSRQCTITTITYIMSCQFFFSQSAKAWWWSVGWLLGVVICAILNLII